VETSLLECLGVLAWFHIGREIFELQLIHFDGALTYFAHILRCSPVYYYSKPEMRVFPSSLEVDEDLLTWQMDHGTIILIIDSFLGFIHLHTCL
jgi:hypothetical protein